MKKRIVAIIILVFMLLLFLSLTAVSADGETLPKGFVKPEEYYEKWDEWDKDNTKHILVGLNKLDGLYLQVLWVECGNCGTYGFYPQIREDPKIKTTLSDKSYITVRRGETVPTFTLSGTYDYEGDKDWNGERQWRKGTMTVTVQNMTLGPIGTAGNSYVYADISGSASTQWKREGKDVQSGTTTVDAKEVQDKMNDWDSSMQYNFNGVGLCLNAGGTYEGDSLGFTGYITIWFKVIGILPANESGTSSGTTQNADQNPGEDGGVSVPAAVAIGVLGGGAAIAGAAAASGGSDDKKKKHKAYKMYVQKDFGDAIRRGGDKPVIIRARMAEVDESGAERDRNDLTANIGVSANGMTVHGAALAERYCEATVSVPKEFDKGTASITFTYIGEGGSFTNTVIFRIVDGPSLKFVDETDGTLYHESCGIDAIPGDGFTYTEQFMIVDAPVAPKLSDITVVNTGEFDVKFELTDQPALYKMTVKNNTKPEPEHDIFAKPVDKNFEIHVNVEGEKEPVKGYVTVKLYPEGITVASTQEGKKNNVKYVRVQAYEKEHVGDLDRKWQVSQIKFTLAAIGKDKAIIDPGEAKYKFEKLKGAGGLGMRAYKEQCLAEKYEYKEAYGEMNGKFTYEFEPNANLAEPDDGTFMMVLLPASCEYDGKTYEAEIPLRLRGKDPDPMADWEKEYKELCRRVEKFSLSQNKDKWLKQVKECAVDPKVSVEELRLVSKWILREYMAYWTTQQSRDQSEAAWCNVIVNTLEWTKFAGDCAFSLLVTMYAGPVAEALISPAKDFITGAIGEVIAARNYGEDIDIDKFEFSKNLAAAGDNLVSNNIKLTNWRQAAATLAGYFCYAAIKNYLLKLREKNESDIWGALCEGFKDMTAAALKSKGGELIGKWIKDSKKFQEKIAPFIVKYFKETNMTTLQHRLNDALGFEGELRKLAGYANDAAVTAKIVDVVDKYVTELVGQGCSKVREAYDSSTFSLNGGHVMFSFTLDLFDAFHFGVTLDLTKILMGMTCPLFSWFYDLFFAGIPAASSVIDTPKDPPLPPANK